MSVRRMFLSTVACAALAVLAPIWPAIAGDGVEPEEFAVAGSTPTWYSAQPNATETVTEYLNTNPLVVPDNECSTGWVSSVITVPDSFFIADVNVGIWVTHTYRGDVEMQLRAPDGTSVLLIADLGAGADNINALFDDSAPGPPDSVNHTAPPPYYTDHPWTPVQPLAAFRGVPLAGDWTLDVCDDAGGDTGTVNQWSLFVETDVVVLDPQAQSALACPGDTVAYGVNVLNGTATTQPFTLTYTGNTWTATGPATTGALASGGEELISFTHEVPVTAMAGDSDTVTFTATGTVTNSATATTTSTAVAGWGDLAQMLPTGRPTRAHAAVYHNGKLYKIGGYDGAARAFLDIYDLATDTWSVGADMPGARYWLDCVAIADKIYCGGGYSTAGQDDLYIYDIATNAWSTGALLPANRYAYTAEALGGKYYILGGYTTTYSRRTSSTTRSPTPGTPPCPA